LAFAPAMRNALAAAFFACLFAALHLVSRSAHSLHPDAADMLYPMLGMLRHEPSLLRGVVCLRLWGLDLPLMFHPYHGPYEGYLSLPFLLAFGPTAWAAYARSTFFGMLSVAGVYLLALRLHRDRGAAALAAALWACSSGFVLASRFGINAGTSVVPMCLWAYWSFLRWLEDAERRWLLAACALLGLACGTRAWCFGLFLSAAATAWPARAALRRAWTRSRGGPVLALQCAAAFGIWFVPMLAGNAMSDWWTARFFQSGRGLLSSFDWRAALLDRAEGVLGLLDGTRWIGLFTEDRHSPAGTPMPLLVAVSVAVTLGIAARRRRGEPAPMRHLLPLAAFAGFFAAALFSPTNRIPNHFYPVLPFLYIAVAALPLLFRTGPSRRKAWAAVLLASLVCAGSDLRVLRWFWTEVERSGGRGSETALAVEDLSRWLAETGRERPLVASAENFAGTILYLTSGKVVPASTYWGPDPERPMDPAWWETAVQRRGAVLLFDMDPPAQAPSLDYMRQAAKRHGLRLERLAVFPRRDGKTVFEAYRAL